MSLSRPASETQLDDFMRHQITSAMNSREPARSESRRHLRSTGIEPERRPQSQQFKGRLTADKENDSRPKSSQGSRSGPLTGDRPPSPGPIYRPNSLNSRRSSQGSRSGHLIGITPAPPAPIINPNDSRAPMIESLLSSRKIRRESPNSRRSSSRGTGTGAKVYVPPSPGKERKGSRRPRTDSRQGSIDGFQLTENLKEDKYDYPKSLREQYVGKPKSAHTSGELTAGNSRSLEEEDQPGSRSGRRSDKFRQATARPRSSDQEKENHSAGLGPEGNNGSLQSSIDRLQSRKDPADDASYGLPLQKVAAARYNGGSLPFNEMVPPLEDVADLNKFLSDCRADVENNLPGKFLVAVIGQENSGIYNIIMPRFVVPDVVNFYTDHTYCSYIW
jgi:hypothetical protein